MAARCLVLLVTVVALAISGCASQSSATAAGAGPSPSERTLIHVSAPSDVPAAGASRVAAVFFEKLPAGSYPVHLHARCDGRPNFHIAVIGTLTVAPGGEGAISVPGPDFDHGWCLIVYGNASLASVVATRAI